MAPYTGDARRIGLLLPSANTVMEPDFYWNMPRGWTVHTARMYLKDTTVEGETAMLDDYAFSAARDVVTVHPHVIVFGCTSAGALRGNEYDVRLMDKLTRQTGVPTVSVFKSVRDALHQVSALRLVIATPYVHELNKRVKASLENDGFAVQRIDGLGICDGFQISQVSGQDIIDFARQAVGNLKPDALFISCTNFPVMSVLDELRDMFPFPVITSNQAVLEATVALVKTGASE